MTRALLMFGIGATSVWLAMHDNGLLAVVAIIAAWGISESTR